MSLMLFYIPHTKMLSNLSVRLIVPVERFL